MGGEDKNASTPTVVVEDAASPSQPTAEADQAQPQTQPEQQDTVTISGVTEYDKYATTPVDAAVGCVHLVTAEADCDDDDDRSPLDLVAVIDVSGSMAGAKLKLAKEALKFVVKNLKPTDTLALVSYHSSIKVEFDLLKMDSTGRARANDAIGKLRDQGCTNLSGGLFQGIQLLQRRKETAGRIGSVMLMTDGMANEGISETSALCDATRRLIGENPNFTIYTFGYGQNHNSDMLTRLSEVGNGMYYFVENNDMIPESFAHCLGGLLTVQAQNLKLILTPTNGASVVKVETDRSTTRDDRTGAYTIDIADLQAEEQRDIVFRFKLDKSVDETTQPIFTAKVQYFDVKTASFKEAACQICVTRDSGDLSSRTQNELVQQQLTRIEAATAMEEAMRLADAGRFHEAQSRMTRTHDMLSSRPDAYAQHLSAELQQCNAFMSASQYRSKGSHEVRTRWQSHAAQRDNITTYAEDEAMPSPTSYTTKSKRKMALRSKGF